MGIFFNICEKKRGFRMGSPAEVLNLEVSGDPQYPGEFFKFG